MSTEFKKLSHTSSLPLKLGALLLAVFTPNAGAQVKGSRAELYGHAMLDMGYGWYTEPIPADAMGQINQVFQRVLEVADEVGRVTAGTGGGCVARAAR